MMLGIMVVLVGLSSFCSVYSHVLMMLLSVEFVMLGLFLILQFLLELFNGELYLSMIFITFMVCEGALGLSMVVLLNRVWGNDYLLSLSLLEC